MDLRTQLVRNVLGDELNSRLSRRLPNILTGLDHHQFASTDEFCINHRWESLCEKFSIKGYGEAADRLRSLKSAFMDPAFSISDDACGTNSSQMVLKYDMLALLLALSSGIPAVGPSSECGRETAPETAAEFWKRTLAEEPLEGDHWKDYCEDSDDISFVSDDEDFEVDEEHLSRRRKARSSADPDMETYRGKSPTDERWDSVFSPMLEDNSFDPLLSGRKQQYWEQQGGSELLEAEVIREILFALRGYPGILFSQYAAAGNGITGSFQFKMENMSSTLRRVSNGAFISILQELNNSANTLLDLRQWSQRVLCDKSNTGMVKYGKTCEATAVCVTGMLLNFERFVSVLELKYCQTNDGQPIISILQLQDTLKSYLTAFEAIHIIVKKAIEPVNSAPRAIASRLLSLLHRTILEKQCSGENDVLNVLVRIHHEAIQPMGRLLDDWMSRADLHGDISNEFLISGVQSRENGHTDNGFQAHFFEGGNNPNIHPIYSANFVDKVLFVGRAIEIIAKFNNEMETLPTFNSCLRHIIPVPQTIFDDIKANPSPERWSEQSMSSTINKTFLQAGFPLFHPPRMEIPDESPRELSITSWLFDEALRQVLEDYVNEPYIQATQKLRNVLWESCTFGLHLGAISSIFLMLEDELMHVFCESLFHEMDEAIYAESSGTNAQIDKLFMDAKIAVGGVHADLTYSTCYFDYHADGSFLDKIRFRYTLPWPLNTYIRSSTFQGYTAIATLLLRLKRTKHLLDRKTFTQERRGMRLHAMRVRMIWFVNAFWSYIMTTILYTETRAFCAAIQKLENVEDITEMHESYMSRIVDRCLLGDMTRAVYTSVLRILDQVQELAQMFVQENTEHENYFDEAMKAMENDFSRDTEFISVSLGIIAKKGGFPWCKLSSISLTAGLLSTS